MHKTKKINKSNVATKKKNPSRMYKTDSVHFNVGSWWLNVKMLILYVSLSFLCSVLLEKDEFATVTLSYKICKCLRNAKSCTILGFS